MEPAPAADKITLIRCLYFDLIGLPPSPTQVDAFLKDNSPSTFEELVDSPLMDERYGEHWARFWLDLVRYSESDGWNQDAYRSKLWRYRDYVVQAFNSDLPYPRFVLDQLAGDETADGLGSANENLPSFVVMCDNSGRSVNGPRNWGSGFMPASAADRTRRANSQLRACIPNAGASLGC